MKNRPRVVLLDDQRIFLDSLHTALDMDGRFDILASHTKGQDALSQLEKSAADLLIMDLAMPEMPGLRVFDQTRRDIPALRVIGLSGLSQMEAIVALWEQGIRGLVHKLDALDVLKEAIVTVMAGRRYMSASLIQQFNQHDQMPRYDELTGREKQVLDGIVQGQTSKEISSVLGINVSTVRTHRENLMQKIDAHSTADIIRFAMAEGLMDTIQPGS
ncbi:MAG: response regulator transcription factor [Magnetococcales bacterium]|nr:response regulator transcription factor [Magnetococcales bacterium]